MKQSVEIKHASIEVFGGCNYKCKVCPQSREQGRGSNWTKTMPLELFKDILDQLPGKPVINLQGSGEPTLLKNLPSYIYECTNRGLRTQIYTNGFNFKNGYMKECINAGLSFVRFSCIGYDKKSYLEQTGFDNFEEIKNNIVALKQYLTETDTQCEVSSYHLIIDPSEKEFEVNEYIKNFIRPCDIVGYIWQPHNWAGTSDIRYERTGEKKTCGRPFAPKVTIRAGGLGGLHGAVVPCCQTMGEPLESQSVLGHLENKSFLEIWNGEKYEELRRAHREKRFEDIAYCKKCDFLHDDQESLVWTNDISMQLGQVLGAEVNINSFK